MKAIAVAALLVCVSVEALGAGAQSPAFKPESLVQFPKSGIARLSKDGLRDVFTYGMQGEKTKAEAMMLGSGDPEAECVSLDPRKRYKVISAEYNDPDHPDLGLLEVVGQGVTSRNGAWTFSVTAEPAK